MFLATSIRYAALPLTSADKGVNHCQERSIPSGNFFWKKPFLFKAFGIQCPCGQRPYLRKPGVYPGKCCPVKFTREAKDTELISIFLRLDCLWAK